MTEYTLKTHIGDGELPVTVEFEYFPGTPAKLSGPMEDCYPAEEYTLEVTDIKVAVWEDNAVVYRSMFEIPEDSWIKHIEQKCLDYVASIGEA